MKRSLFVFVGLLLIASSILTGCGTETPEASDAFRVAFVYIGPPGDLGWTYEHDRGRQILAEEFGDAVETATSESVEEGPDSARVFREYAQNGYDMVFATSFGYMDHMYEVAEEFPDVLFEHCSGSKTRDNMATYFGRIYQPRYLSGLVAGSMTEANNIGYVAAFPMPEVVRGINAFTLGVREVNPEATVNVVWTNTWYNPDEERKAAESLLDAGADIIAQHQDTTEPQKAAQERGALSIGYHSDMRAFVGDTVLTSAMWNWGPYYIETVGDAMNGEWETHQPWGGLEDGIVQLADYSPKVPQDVRDLVETERQAILDGDDVFCGPINAADGSVLVADGECMSDEDMLGMMVFVEGVSGTIPEQ
ncbi:MAG: BMP family ABC transporter substrate-binding protein [Anaerolineae bacterium]